MSDPNALAQTITFSDGLEPDVTPEIMKAAEVDFNRFVESPSSLDAIIDVFEGGGRRSPDTADPGGTTRFGISESFISNSLPDVEDASQFVLDLDRPAAMKLYERFFIQEPGFNNLPRPLADVVVDFGIHSGPVDATKALQSAIGVKPDGHLGPETLGKLAGMNQFEIATKVLNARQKKLLGLIRRERNPRRRAQLKSAWLRRIQVLRMLNREAATAFGLSGGRNIGQ